MLVLFGQYICRSAIRACPPGHRWAGWQPGTKKRALGPLLVFL